MIYESLLDAAYMIINLKIMEFNGVKKVRVYIGYVLIVSYVNFEGHLN